MITKRNMAFIAAMVFAGGLSTSMLLAGEESQDALMAQTKITQAEAEKTALARVPGGIINSAELEKENGKLIWSFDISMSTSGNIMEVQVDARTGKIVSTQTETPVDQAKEAEADKMKK
ncbi:MAG: PepSY domain-containing protein [Nitrospiria bacterium]